MRLAGQDHEAHRLAGCVRDCDDLAGQTAPGAADSLTQGSPWRAGGLPVRLDDGAVDGQVFRVELFGQSLENTLENRACAFRWGGKPEEPGASCKRGY